MAAFVAALAPTTAAARQMLTLTACTMDDAGNINATSNKFEMMINPEKYSYAYAIRSNRQRHLGAIGNTNQFSALEPEEIKFEDVVLDGTGAVAPAGGGVTPDVKTQVKSLIDIVYTYSGDRHEPPWVRLLWGNLIFFGRLKDLKINYTLFNPGGEPLRARLELTFSSAMSPQEEALRANRSSPDLSHQITVREGDTLPLLCYKVYRDSSYYPEVASYNQLTDFRSLQPGMTLFFPPLV